MCVTCVRAYERGKNMDVQKWLEQVGMLDELINAKLAEREQLMSLAVRLNPEMDGMPHAKGNVSDPVGNGAVKLVELAHEIDRLIDQYIDHKKMVTKALQKLPARQYSALHKHYILYMTWEQVAEAMNKSTMQVYRYHKKGLENLENVIECYTII